MAYDGDRYIYAGSVAGVLSRIEIGTGMVEKVANAMPSVRFPAMAMKDGIVYGGGGMNGRLSSFAGTRKATRWSFFKTWLRRSSTTARSAFTSWRSMMNINFSWAKTTTINAPVTSGQFGLTSKISTCSGSCTT